MKRSVSASVVTLLLTTAAIPSAALAQAKSPALASAPAPAPAPAAAPGKWVAPVKGVATIEVIRTPAKKVGKELVTSITIKNTSSGSISLLKVEEMWYDTKRDLVTSGKSFYRKPFLPGEVITMEVSSPVIGKPEVSQFSFAHANGKIEAKPVKKFD